MLDSDSLYNVFDKTQFLHFTEGSQLVDTEVSICTLNIFSGVPTFKGVV